MSRAERPHFLHGVLVVDKPSGPTSHDVVVRVRELVRPSRVGHTGTLDPMATGILVLCVGSATRLASRLTGGVKEYTGLITLGASTSTYDADGDVVQRRPTEGLDVQRIRLAAATLEGDLLQTPPPWSAKKIDGKRAYDIARAGETPALAPCRVRVDRFEILWQEGDRCAFHVKCSRGTYVRSLAHDLGSRLGSGAHLASLRRERNGNFGPADTHSLSDLEAAAREGRLREIMIGMESLDLGLPSVSLTSEGEKAAAAGRLLSADLLEAGSVMPEAGEVRLVSSEGRLLGIAEAVLVPARSLQPRTMLSERGSGIGDGGRRGRSFSRESNP